MKYKKNTFYAINNPKVDTERSAFKDLRYVKVLLISKGKDVVHYYKNTTDEEKSGFDYFDRTTGFCGSKDYDIYIITPAEEPKKPKKTKKAKVKTIWEL